MEINQIVREHRTRMGWNQRKLADALGLSQPVIAWWETGKNSPVLKHRIRMARLFGVSVTELLPEAATENTEAT
jgi:putative transcriptional regulator